MEFGMFHQFPSLPGRSDADTFAEAFEQIDAAEELGLDVMWLAELHFDPQRSVLSAPLSIASAVAARTRRIKIGIAVQVLPLCHPLRLAEEAATVDQISRGRLIFGVGRSGLPRTYEDYGVSYGESRERFAEVLDIVEQAWSQPVVHYEGRYYRFNNIAVTPKPFQQPLPPIRIAAASPDTYPAVGERGLPIFINARHGSFSEFAPAVREYREAYKAAGHPGRGRVYLRVPTYLAETAGMAREEPRDSLMHFYREQTERLRELDVSRRHARDRRPGGAPRAPRKADLRRSLAGSGADRHAASGGGQAARFAAGAGHRRDIGRAELRRPDPACAGHDRTAAAVRRGHAPVSVTGPPAGGRAGGEAADGDRCLPMTA